MRTVEAVEIGYRAAARAHARKYPRMRAQDFVKLAYQHALGCEHMVNLSSETVHRLAQERQGGGVCFEDIGNGLVRAHLRGEKNPMSTDLIARMFASSARLFCAEDGALETALTELAELAARGEIPVSEAEMAAYLGQYRAENCPAVHHSPEFRSEYEPHYRVLLKLFSDYCELFCALETLKKHKPGAIVAIDGMCASGKTTLARAIAAALDANVYHMDDFFLRPEMRTKERLNAPGGNVDHERFLREVLLPLMRGERFSYRPFDCGKMALSTPVESAPAALNIVEGAYSCHPALRQYYDLTVCVEVDGAVQKERILARNGETMLARFQSEWIPMENRYLAHFSLPESVNFRYRVLRNISE